MPARRRRLEPADLGWQNSWQLNCAAIPELGSSYRSANRMLLAGGWRTTEYCGTWLSEFRMLWRGRSGCTERCGAGALARETSCCGAGARGVPNAVARAPSPAELRPRGDYAEGPQHLACRIAEL